MSASQTDENEPTERESWRDILLATMVIVYWVVLLGVCTIGPIVATSYQPWIGLIAAVAAVPAWIYLGPPPMPGFVNGIVALGGILMIVTVALYCLVKLIVA